MAKGHIQPERITLFGSRARDDCKLSADFDLAFYFAGSRSEKWSWFCAEVAENPWTLCQFDLVDLNEASGDIKKSVKEEGIILYESKKH